MTIIELAKYRDGQLCLEACDTQTVSYLAVSHVWSDAEYRDLPSFSVRPVLVSQHKWNFLVDRLPGLVGTEWFWMDVICVDQRSEDARIAVVDHIPEIFRNASKTIVVKDGDAFHACCRKAIGLCGTDNAWHQALYNHLRENHFTKLMTDSWLDRLWPLEETMLSNTLHFTSCEDRDSDNEKVYGEETSYHHLRDDLWTVSHAWVAYGRERENVADKFEEETIAFMNAYIHNGTIIRRALPDSAFDTRGFGWELRQHTNSRRKTSKARDFILAIMPQYGWYKAPKGVKKMEFPQIFSDCYRQAMATSTDVNQLARKEVSFVPRLTRGMVEPTLSSAATIQPSHEMPVPETLGDFVKLLGSTASHAKAGSKLGLLLGEVQVTDFSGDIPISDALEAIRESMRFSKRKWELAYIGELSDFDYLPESRVGPMEIYPRSWTDDQDSESSYRAQAARKIRQAIGKRMSNEHVVSECCRVLNSMWAAQHYSIHQGEWHQYEKWLLEHSPPGYANALIYLAALISCNIGISGLDWFCERMVPVVVKLEDYSLLGLIQSGAVFLKDAYYSSQYFKGYYAVQRFSDMGGNFDVNGFTGRDCVLTVKLELGDLKVEEGVISYEIVGLLPDFVDPDTKDNFLERFEAVFPNDGKVAAMPWVGLG